MTEWSEESISKAEMALAVMPGTWHEKIAAAINAAIAQREAEETAARNERLKQKIEELEGLS